MSGRQYVERTYRAWSEEDPELVTFQVKVRETDLLVRLGAEAGAPEELRRLTEDLVREVRRGLETYLALDPAFRTALTPHPVPAHAPSIVRRMAEAAATCRVGPMAAVAGAISAQVGEELRRFTPEVIVENGGDLYLASGKACTIAVFAGESPFTGRLGLRLSPDRLPAGVCTSAGTVGPSLSFGKADAAVIIARDPALADAAATTVGNLVQAPGDLELAAEYALTIPGVTGALVVKNDAMAAAGKLDLIRLAPARLRSRSSE
jgi:hypothetical protein